MKSNICPSTEILEIKLKLNQAKEIQKIKDFFFEARCPVCGHKGINIDIAVHQNEAMSYGYATVRCCQCGIFNYKKRISGYDAYHWVWDGSSELEMLRELKYSTEKYLK